MRTVAAVGWHNTLSLLMVTNCWPRASVAAAAAALSCSPLSHPFPAPAPQPSVGCWCHPAQSHGQCAQLSLHQCHTCTHSNAHSNSDLVKSARKMQAHTNRCCRYPVHWQYITHTQQTAAAHPALPKGLPPPPLLVHAIATNFGRAVTAPKVRVPSQLLRPGLSAAHLFLSSLTV
jgi:hypothetical protein